MYLFIHLIIIILILSDSFEIEISELDLLIEKKKLLQQAPQHNYGCEILSGIFILSFLVVLVVVLVTLKKYS